MSNLNHPSEITESTRWQWWCASVHFIFFLIITKNHLNKVTVISKLIQSTIKSDTFKFIISNDNIKKNNNNKQEQDKTFMIILYFWKWKQQSTRINYYYYYPILLRTKIIMDSPWWMSQKWILSIEYRFRLLLIIMIWDRSKEKSNQTIKVKHWNKIIFQSIIHHDHNIITITSWWFIKYNQNQFV